MTTLSGKYRPYLEPNRRVLVVDDNGAIHEDFRKTLGGSRSPGRADLAALESELFGEESAAVSQQFELASAFQGEEALALVSAARDNNEPFALAFVDVRMPPGLDGIATTARLLEIDPEINIVVCSAYSDHSWEEMAQVIGSTDRVLILKKPFDTIEVRQLAHALQRRWELARMVSIKVDDLSARIDSKTRELEITNAKLKEEASAREEALDNLAKSHEQIRALAYQDGLTGLPNRRLLNEHLEKVLARCHRKNIEFAVLFVDLDNFKLINDTIGHQAADAVLHQFAEALSSLIRSEDVLALYMEQDIDLDSTISLAPITESVLSRLGGDEFVILLPEIKDRFAAGSVAHRILNRLEQSFAAGTNEVFLTASIGIATYPADGQTTEMLIRNADTAMYHAKQQGKAAYQYYSEEMNAASVERLTLENGLHRALDEGRLELHYQPEVDAATGLIVGAEALLRWNDPTRGYVPPAAFIPIAEDGGMILAIGEWVARKACAQAVAWQRSGLRPIPISINVSGVQFRRQDVCALVRTALAETGLDAGLLRVEITETSLMSVRDAADLMRELRAIGAGIALDDFGTGYSSLSYLKSFPLDMLKIDRSFIAEMLTDEKTASITEAIITMGRILGLRVCAEGVESQEQLELLRKLGCHTMQGFHFAPALPPAQFAARLAAEQPRALSGRRAIR